MGLAGRSLVTHVFKGFKAARKANKELWSPELTFQLVEHPSLSYSFKLVLYPNGDGLANKGTVNLKWVPRVGSQPPGHLTWPIPHDKVIIALRIISLSARANGAKQRKVKGKLVIDGGEGDREFLAKHAPPSKCNSEAWGFASFITKEVFEEGGWTIGPNDDMLLVQAELILK